MPAPISQTLAAPAAASGAMASAESVVALLPNLPETFRRQVEALETAITGDHLIRDTAATALRALIERIVAAPTEPRGSWSIEIMTRPGALLALGLVV